MAKASCLKDEKLNQFLCVCVLISFCSLSTKQEEQIGFHFARVQGSIV